MAECGAPSVFCESGAEWHYTCHLTAGHDLTDDNTWADHIYVLDPGQTPPADGQQ